MAASSLGRRALLLGLTLLLPAVAQAQTVADIESTWRDWMSRNRRIAGGLVVLHKGLPVHEAALGRIRPGQPVPLASLSKAVTAVCAARLVEQGRLSFESRVAQMIPKTLARVGPPADARLLQATLGQLLAHRAGYGRHPGDPTTSGALATYLRGATARTTAFDAQLKWTLKVPLSSAPGERYEYTNATYLLAGAIIEETTGRDYESVCRESVLTPLGARTATLDPDWRILASYGGWRMALADYGRFYQAFAASNPAIGPAARAWMMSPEGKSLGGGAHYGLGTDVRTVAGGAANFWHWGSWSYNLADAHDGALSASYATFAVRWGGSDANVVVYMEPRVEEGSLRTDLDRSLGKAVGAVTRWP